MCDPLDGEMGVMVLEVLGQRIEEVKTVQVG